MNVAQQSLTELEKRDLSHNACYEPPRGLRIWAVYDPVVKRICFCSPSRAECSLYARQYCRVYDVSFSHLHVLRFDQCNIY